MGRKLILNDGTILEGSEAGYADGFLWLYLANMSLQDAVVIVFNTNKTKKIIFQYENMQDIYENFTECIHLSVSHNGQVSVCMKKGETDVEYR